MASPGPSPPPPRAPRGSWNSSSQFKHRRTRAHATANPTATPGLFGDPVSAPFLSGTLSRTGNIRNQFLGIQNRGPESESQGSGIQCRESPSGPHSKLLFSFWMQVNSLDLLMEADSRNKVLVCHTHPAPATCTEAIKALWAVFSGACEGPLPNTPDIPNPQHRPL